MIVGPQLVIGWVVAQPLSASRLSIKPVSKLDHKITSCFRRYYLVIADPEEEGCSNKRVDLFGDKVAPGLGLVLENLEMLKIWICHLLFVALSHHVFIKVV